MNTTRPRHATRPHTGRGCTSFLHLALFSLAALPPLAAAESQATKQPAKAESDDSAEIDILSMTAYNVKADRIEDFGLRVEGLPYKDAARPNVVTLWFTTFAPLITAIVPNTAAAKAGLQPGERILKSDGASTVGGPFSTGKFGQWSKAQKKKWADVAAGKTNVTWNLEVESPVTKAVRTVKLVIPTPPPRWGASVWRPPEGRKPSVVSEPGILAQRSREILDNGIWSLVSRDHWRGLGLELPADSAPTAYAWHFGNWSEGRHLMAVAQVRERTHVLLTVSGGGGARDYLTSPSGVLEKAYRWRRGKMEDIPLEQAGEEFAKVLDLWTTKVGQYSPRWPLELKPGYDPNTIFAKSQKNGATSAPAARSLAKEFLKLPRATETQQALFADAYGKLGAEPDRWAYTETTRGLDDKRVWVTRVDPSKPEADRGELLSIDGRAPTPADVERWRNDGGDVPKPLGDIPPLATLVDLKDLRLAHDDATTVVFELPIRGDSAEFPAEKFQALFRVNKIQRAFEDITVKLRDSFRVAGVVKVTEAGLLARFQTLDPAHPPQPVLLKGGGAARIVLVKVARDFETTRTDFKRVRPFDEAVAP
jgi:hypothetical protein